MSKIILEHNDVTSNKPNIRWCPLTVEHPFDRNFGKNYTDNDWVHLVGLDQFDLDDDEQALLLCPYSNVEWVTWLPSQGETIIHRDNMCRIRK